MEHDIIKDINKGLISLLYATLDIRSMDGEERSRFLRENEEILKELASYVKEESDDILSWYENKSRDKDALKEKAVMNDKTEYFEAKNELDKIKRENDLLFRLGLNHLIDVGRRHLTEKEVENTCSEIMSSNGSKMITPEFMCGIVRTAYRISKIDTSFLLKYIADNIDDIVQILGVDNDDEDGESISD